jgi:hypothetical protein
MDQSIDCHSQFAATALLIFHESIWDTWFLVSVFSSLFYFTHKPVSRWVHIPTYFPHKVRVGACASVHFIFAICFFKHTYWVGSGIASQRIRSVSSRLSLPLLHCIELLLSFTTAAACWNAWTGLPP